MQGCACCTPHLNLEWHHGLRREHRLRTPEVCDSLTRALALGFARSSPPLGQRGGVSRDFPSGSSRASGTHGRQRVGSIPGVSR